MSSPPPPSPTKSSSHADSSNKENRPPNIFTGSSSCIQDIKAAQALLNASIHQLISKQPDRLVLKPIAKKRKRPSKVVGSPLGKRLQADLTQKIGNLSGIMQRMETFLQSHQMSELGVTPLSDVLKKISCNLGRLYVRLSCIMDQLEPGSLDVPGVKLALKLIPKTPILNFGTGTKTNPIVLSTNSEAISPSATCCDGSTVTPSVSRSKEEQLFLVRTPSGSQAISTLLNGTHCSMKKPKLPSLGGSQISSTLSSPSPEYRGEMDHTRSPEMWKDVMETTEPSKPRSRVIVVEEWNKPEKISPPKLKSDEEWYEPNWEIRRCRGCGHNNAYTEMRCHNCDEAIFDQPTSSIKEDYEENKRLYEKGQWINWSDYRKSYD